MKTRKLGSLEVSEVGLGCMGMHHAYGAPRDEKEMIKLIHKTVDLGITFFDTKEGKIAHWGMSEANAEQIRKAHAVCPVTAVQNRYSMMTRGWEDTVFPVCEELGIGYVVAFSPLVNGFLSGAYDKNSKFDKDTDFRSFLPEFQPENMDAHQVLLDLIEKFAAAKNATKAQISLAWILAKRPFIVPIFGTTKEERLLENAGCVNVTFTGEELVQLNEALSHIEIKGVYMGAKAK